MIVTALLPRRSGTKSGRRNANDNSSEAVDGSGDISPGQRLGLINHAGQRGVVARSYRPRSTRDR